MVLFMTMPASTSKRRFFSIPVFSPVTHCLIFKAVRVLCAGLPAICALSISNSAYAADNMDNTIDANQIETIEVLSKQKNSSNPSTNNLTYLGAYDSVNRLGQNFKKTEYPQQILNISHKKIEAQQANTLQDIAQLDTSLNQNYAPLGYQENFSLRGLPLNLDASYLLNGVPSSHRQIPNLSNKENIEVIKGSAALDSANASAGGVINYQTKRAKNIRAVQVHGQNTGEYGFSTDIGYKTENNGTNSTNNIFGYRLNTDYTKLKPYVKSATGEKYLLSLALDGKVDNFNWQFDADYQKHQQYSVPGYQLLGGENIPQNVKPQTMLNNPIWRKPVDTTAYNIGSKWGYTITPDLDITSSMQHSKTKIDDYVAFPYSFKNNGNYKLADYQSPDQTYRNNYADINLHYAFNLGQTKHKLNVGYSYLDFAKYAKNSITAGKEVRNIYNTDTVIQSYKATDEVLGDTYKNIQHKQSNILIRDVIEMGKLKIFLGGRFTQVKEKSFSGTSTPIGQEQSTTTINKFLPNIAALYQWQPDFSTYINYSKNVEIGRDADVLGYNSSYLPARINKNLEIGFNYACKICHIQGAYFDISRPYEYVNDAYTFVQEGKEKRKGLELNIASRWQYLNYGLNTTYYLNATQNNTSNTSINGANAVNVPKLQTYAWVDYRIPSIDGLSLNASMHYSAHKPVNKEASINIPSYTVWNTGISYNKKLNDSNIKMLKLRLGIDNVFNKNYWKDAGEAFGESYIHLGAPRTYKATLGLEFN
jgi:iron complex outermembrane recepter protein